MATPPTRGSGRDWVVVSTAVDSDTLSLAISAFIAGFSMCEMMFSDRKCKKDYYHCSFRRRFKFGYEFRVMRDTETSLINIEALRGVQHSDERLKQ